MRISHGGSNSGTLLKSEVSVLVTIVTAKSIAIPKLTIASTERGR